MKKKIIILMCFCSLLHTTYAQVGINTSNPQATFHIDGQKNNPQQVFRILPNNLMIL
jgi:hypothetical protein